MPVKAKKPIPFRTKSDIPGLMAGIRRVRSNWRNLSSNPISGIQKYTMNGFLREGNHTLLEAEKTILTVQTALDHLSSVLPKIASWDKRYWELLAASRAAASPVRKKRQRAGSADLRQSA